jgi:hypothetical protein
LLRGAGFNVISGKEKIELSIFVDEEEYESRLYIDYVVQKDQSTYVVVVAKERKPIRMSGPSLRDAFFSQYLLFRPDGILYVNRERGSMKLIEFEVPDCSPETRDWASSMYAVAFGLGLGILVTWLLLR